VVVRPSWCMPNLIATIRRVCQGEKRAHVTLVSVRGQLSIMRGSAEGRPRTSAGNRKGPRCRLAMKIGTAKLGAGGLQSEA
jgi:hypothetical protein